MEKTSAQESYLQYLRTKYAAEVRQNKESAASCGASAALAKHKKKFKKATIIKESQGPAGYPGGPMLIDPDTQRRLAEHNRKAMRTAGGILGIGGGLLGGGALGAGIGAIAGGPLKRLRGAGYGALAGGAGGALLGGLFGPGVGEEASKDVTQQDIATLNQLAQQQLAQAGYGPYAGDIQASATFGKNTGDERPFSIDDYYWKGASAEGLLKEARIPMGLLRGASKFLSGIGKTAPRAMSGRMPSALGAKSLQARMPSRGMQQALQSAPRTGLKGLYDKAQYQAGKWMQGGGMEPILRSPGIAF